MPIQKLHIKEDVTKTEYRKLFSDINLGFGSDMHYRGYKFGFRKIIRFFKDIRYELKAAWLRIKRGYDDAAVWNMNYFLSAYTTRALLELADMAHGMPVLEEWQNEDNDTQFKLWKERLVEIATHFHESIASEEYRNEKNEYDKSYHNSFDYGFDLNCDEWHIPKAGYTKEQVDELEQKYRHREQEIEEYQEEQRKIGFEKLLEIYDHLWD